MKSTKPSVSKPSINVPALDRPWLKSFTHLRDIEFPHKDGPVDLILGVEYSHLHAESEIRQGLPFEPLGKRTKLGWHVIGPENSRAPPMCFMNFVSKVNLGKFYEFETLGVRAPECSCPLNVMSREDKRAIELFESSCR